MDERKKILIGIPYNMAIDPEVNVSIFNTTTQLVSKGYKVDTRFNEGTLIVQQRNILALQAAQEGSDLLFIDSDIVFKPGEADELIESGKDVIGGLYFNRRSPFNPIAYRYIGKDEKINEILDEADLRKEGDEYFTALKIDEIPKEIFTREDGLGVGAGFLYIKHHVLKKMFETQVVLDLGRPFNHWKLLNGDQLGEDLSFCYRAKLLGYQVYCHGGLDLQHIGRIRVNRDTHVRLTAINQLYSNDIEGWMLPSELNWLYHTAKKMETIVELGSWKGRSTHALLSGTSGTVTAVDHFRGSRAERRGPHKEAVEKDIFPDFKRAVGKFSNLIVDRVDSLECAKKHKDKSVDMVFIDAGHTTEEVKADIEAWLPKAKKMICGHDFQFNEVEMAVRESLGEVRQFETIWFKEIENGKVKP